MAAVRKAKIASFGFPPPVPDYNRFFSAVKKKIENSQIKIRPLKTALSSQNAADYSGRCAIGSLCAAWRPSRVCYKGRSDLFDRVCFVDPAASVAHYEADLVGYWRGRSDLGLLIVGSCFCCLKVYTLKPNSQGSQDRRYLV